MMLHAFFYKEWIKLRLPFTLLLTFQLLWLFNLVFGLYSKLGNDNILLWFDWIWGGNIPFARFAPLPAIMGILMALAQYIPEITEKRLKLMLHLPLPQNRIIGYHLLIGQLMLTLIWLPAFAIMNLCVALWFPADLHYSLFISVLPWWLAGYCSYNLTALMVMEGQNRYRLTYLLMITGFFFWLTRSDYHQWYSPEILRVLLLTLATLPLPLLSIQRFRQGITS